MMSGECKNTFKGHTDKVLCVAVSGDGQTVVSGSEDKTVRWVAARRMLADRCCFYSNIYFTKTCTCPTGQNVGPCVRRG